VGWSILDTDISPDRHHLLYSSWSDYSTPTTRLLFSLTGIRLVSQRWEEGRESLMEEHISSFHHPVHMVDISADAEQDARHEALDLKPRAQRFCVFSLQYSHDGSEVLAGSSDQSLYIYDLHRRYSCTAILVLLHCWALNVQLYSGHRERTLCIDAHSDDINSVSWADETSHILFSASDGTSRFLYAGF
jgi:WD repeat-containing protein 23